MADISQPDDTVPSVERQAELEAAYQKNVAAGNAPYAEVSIRTRGELRWVMRKRGWMGNYEASVNPAKRADFRHAWLTSFLDRAIHPPDVNLAGIELQFADLSNARLDDTELSHADLYEATLTDAVLGGANLSGATLANTDLGDADMSYTNLTGTDLSEAFLGGAILSGSYMDVRTLLWDTEFDEHTQVADVIWNNVPLTRVKWDKVSILGDETDARKFVDDKGKVISLFGRQEGYQEGYEDAFRAYRQLSVALRSQGITDAADHYGYRAQLMQREVYRLQGKHGWWLFWYFLDWLAGYGYKPQRTLIWYGSALAVSTFAYFILALSHTPGMALWTHQMWVALFESFIASLTSLHGRGLFPGHTESHWQWLIAGADAVVGLVIEASFVATFVQRFFAR